MANVQNIAINLQTANRSLQLEQHEEEALHRMYGEVRASIATEKQELLQHENILTMIQSVETEMQAVQGQTQKIIDFNKALEGLKNSKGLRGLASLQEVNRIQGQITITASQVDEKVKRIQTQISAIEEVVKKARNMVQIDKKIEDTLFTWTSTVRNNLQMLHKAAMDEKMPTYKL